LVLVPKREWRDLSSRALTKTVGVLQIVDLLQEYGLDINKISRLTGQHKETVRYRYNSALRDNGMIVEAAIDESALGLKPIGTRVTLRESLIPLAPEFWNLLHEFAYLRSEDASLTDDSYFLRWAVPTEHVRHFRDFILKLEELGVLQETQFFDFGWFRRVPMAAQYYDFNTQRWKFDWKQATPSSPPIWKAPEPRRAERVQFDKADILLASELQADAGRSMVEIRSAIESKKEVVLKYKTLHYHYYAHVLKNRLVRRHVIGWHGALPGKRPGAARRQMNRYLIVSFLASRIDGFERDQLMNRMGRTPFLWAEAGGNDYLARCAFPNEMTPEALEYMRDTLRLLRGKTNYYLVDQKNSRIFTINDRLWDSTRREWRFDDQKALSALERLIARERLP
jgi:hypothetical protein